MDTTLEFYEHLASDYHLVYADWRRSVERQGETLDRLIRAALGPPPRSVLDCTCGIGTQAIGLAARGYRVHATDLSPAAVERARREAASFGVSLTFGVADLRTLEAQVAGTFDVVLACDNSLAHLVRDADLRLAARNMWAKVQTGGLLLASMRDYDQLVQEQPRATAPLVCVTPEGRRIVFMVWDWANDLRTYVGHLFIVREAAGVWQTAHHATTFRAYQRSEIDVTLREAGFADLRWHTPEESGYYQPVVTARRR